MAESKTLIRTFNRGLVSQLALARTDLERVPLSADTMNNWMPRNLGSMMLRPGTAYIGNTASNNKARVIPFIFSTDDTALIEITDSTMRVWVDDALVTRPSVSTTITNGDFTTNLNDWTDNDEAGGVSAHWSTGGGTGFLAIYGDGTSSGGRGIRTQEVTVAAGDQGVEHVLEINASVTYDTATPPMVLKVGSTDGDDDYIATTELETGYHSLSFTPTGNFWIEFSNNRKDASYIDSVAVASSGVMSLTAPWAEADLGKIRYDQSGDIIYLAAEGYHPQQIKRREAGSWSLVRYAPEDGPFRTINTSAITMTPNSIDGAVTLTASADYFTAGMVGTLFRITSAGQTVTSSISAQNVFTNTIRVTGITNARVFTYTMTNRTDSTITLQRSLESADSGFKDVLTTTTNETVSYDDTLDNQIAWYRIGIKTGDYGTDTVGLTLDYPNGSIDGVTRVTIVTSSTQASTQAIKDLGGTDATLNWYEGEWSTHRGFPSAVSFAEGRLAWASDNKVNLSVSDDYYSFDDSVAGDSGPITRTIGSGPVDHINWMLGLKRLCFGTDSIEWNLRTSNEDEPLTPSNSIPRRISTQGSAEVHGVMLDRSGLFVQRGGTRLMEVAFNTADYEFDSIDLSTLYPESGGDSKIVRIALQRQPDTRIHCVREDGTVALLLHDKAENISCWVTLSAGQTTAIAGYAFQSQTAASTPVSGFEISDDGAKMFVFRGGSTGTVYEYDLLTPYDTSTLQDTGNSLSLTTELASGGIGIFAKPDGTKFYAIDNTADAIFEYDCLQAWSIASASYNGNTVDITTTTSNPRGIHLDESGTRLYVVDGTFGIYQFSLDTAFDISTASYDSISFDVTTQETLPQSVFIDSSGTRMYVTGVAKEVNDYTLGVAWDCSSAEFSGVKDVSGDITTGVNHITLKADLTEMYLQSTGGIVQYTQEAGGAIEDVAVLPGEDGDGEDAVYYSVTRIIGGATVRFLEKWSLESENQGGTTNKQVDVHISGTVTGGVLTGLSHLEGENVSVWANGKDVGTYTVSGGQITGVTEDGSAIAGLRYMAQFKSTKLGNLTMKKQASRLGLILRNTHYQGIVYGVDFDNLDPLPLVKDESIIDEDTIHTTFDEESFSLDGVWEADARLCLQAESPRPVTVLAAIIDLEE